MAPRLPVRRVLSVPRFAQPDDVSCGPSCLAQVLAYYGDVQQISALSDRVRRNPDGGTLAVNLAHLALDLGYRVRLYPFGVRVFDPSWWELEDAEIAERLDLRSRGLADPVERAVVKAWRDLLRRGGYVAFHEPSPALLARIIAQDRPLICGLNATWLYREPRDRPHDNVPDDIDGWPVGHFVVLHGYTGRGLHFHVNDPSEDAPFSAGGDPMGPRTGHYPLPADRLIHAILLGDATRDAVLLEIWPPHGGAHPAPLCPEHL